jgi:hypothetical protein
MSTAGMNVKGTGNCVLPMQARIDLVVDDSWYAARIGTVITRANDHCVIWIGYVEAPMTCTCVVYGHTDDGMRITFDGGVSVVRARSSRPSMAAAPTSMCPGSRAAARKRSFQGRGIPRRSDLKLIVAEPFAQAANSLNR